MKNLFYFTFGFITMLLLVSLFISHYGEEFIHDYWLERLYSDLSKIYAYTNLTITFLWGLCSIIFAYNLGKQTRKIDENWKLNENSHSTTQCDGCNTDSDKNQ